MKNKYLDMLSKEEFDELLKQLNFETYTEEDCFQGTRRLNMSDGAIGIYTYKFRPTKDERIIYLNDYKIRHSNKNKSLPNDLAVDKQRTEALFIYMIMKFDNYFEEAKEHCKKKPCLLRVLRSAYKKVELTRKTNPKAVEDEGGASSL
ncbi:MAG: hypothetical protein J6K97_02845 [Clostridia bacterium]|nr:hypothetical protein [Clostridia bacterium]